MRVFLLAQTKVDPPPALAICLFLAVSTCEAAPITYDLLPQSLQPGNAPIDAPNFVVSGSITTDGTLGPLAAVNVLAWDWKATNGLETYLASSEVGSISVLTGLNATQNQLYLPNASILALDSLGIFLEFRSQPNFKSVSLFDAPLPSPPFAKSTTRMDQPDFIIATVPEPSTFVLAALGLLLLSLKRKAG